MKMIRSELTESTVIATRKETVDRYGEYDKAARKINDSYIIYFPVKIREKYSWLPHFDIRVDLLATSRHVRKDGIYILCSSFKDNYTSLILGFGRTDDFAMANLEFNLTRYVNELIKTPDKFYQYLVDNGFEMKVEPSFFKATDTLSFEWSVTRPIPPTKISTCDERMCGPIGYQEYWDRRKQGFGHSYGPYAIGQAKPVSHRMINVWFPEYPYREAGLFYGKNLNSKKEIKFEEEFWDIRKNEAVRTKLQDLTDEILKLLDVNIDPPEDSREQGTKIQLECMLEFALWKGLRRAKNFLEGKD